MKVRPPTQNEIRQKEAKQDSKQAAQKRAYTPAFGLLAATCGIFAGGAPLPMAGLGLLFAGLYLLAERQGWLLTSLNGHSWRDLGVTAVFAGLVSAFVFLTGGAHSPMPCALYLPVLLASLCYGMRLGLTASFAMISVAAFLATGGHLPTAFPSPRTIAIGMSFPVVAVFGGALRGQMESRLLTLSSEKKDLADLLDMSQMMDAAFDLDMTLNLILLNVQELSDCQVCAVYLKATDGRTLELRAASCPPHAAALLPAFSIDDGRADGWWVAEPVQDGLNLRAFYTAGTEPFPAKSRLFEIDPDSRSFACLPLSSVEGLLGMIYIGYKQPSALTAEGVRRLEQLAARAIFPCSGFCFSRISGHWLTVMR